MRIDDNDNLPADLFDGDTSIRHFRLLSFLESSSELGRVNGVREISTMAHHEPITFVQTGSPPFRTFVFSILYSRI